MTHVLTQHQLDAARADNAAVARIATAPDARVETTRTSVGGTVTVVFSAGQRAAVIATAGMASLPAAEIYQLWVIGPGWCALGRLALPSRPGRLGAGLMGSARRQDRDNRRALRRDIEPDHDTGRRRAGARVVPSGPARRPAGNSRPLGDGHLAALDGDGRHWSAAVVSSGAGPGFEQSPSPLRAGRWGAAQVAGREAAADARGPAWEECLRPAACAGVCSPGSPAPRVISSSQKSPELFPARDPSGRPPATKQRHERRSGAGEGPAGGDTGWALGRPPAPLPGGRYRCRGQFTMLSWQNSK